MIAPNPTSSYLFVEIEKVNAEDIIIELINARGDIVYKDTFSEYSEYFSHRYDVNHLNPGIYFLRISNGDYSEKQKVIIMR